MRGFAKSAKWCGHYLEICRRLSAIAEDIQEPARSAVRLRTAQIALSLGKNIRAYKLEGEAKAEAERFFRTNRTEIAACACAAGSTPMRLQGMLIQSAPSLYLGLCSLVYRLRDRWSDHRCV